MTIKVPFRLRFCWERRLNGGCISVFGTVKSFFQSYLKRYGSQIITFESFDALEYFLAFSRVGRDSEDSTEISPISGFTLLCRVNDGKARSGGELMFQPEVYSLALAFMIGSMICWGSWANTMKLTPGWAFQLYYWDYVAGIVLTTLFWGLTMGSFGADGLSFLADLRQASTGHFLYAIAGGIAFNVANLLLVAAIEIAGMAVAFPLGIGIALVVGVLLSYLLAPVGNLWMLLTGVALVMTAIVFDAIAYRRRETVKKRASTLGIVLSLICGVLMGLFYPLVSKASDGPGALGPYAVAFIFALGVALCTVPCNLWLIYRPLLRSGPIRMRNYVQAPLHWHIWALAGGGIWATGAVLNFVASHAALVGPAVSYAIGQGATMISAAWGVFVWREFADAPHKSRKLIPYMFLLFLTGLALVAVTPLVR